MARMYGCAGRLTAKNGGFRPGQTEGRDKWCRTMQYLARTAVFFTGRAGARVADAHRDLRLV
jgi:hypothetical protein